MNGLMQRQPLLISSLLRHAERHHGEQQVVSRRVEGDIHRTTYRELAARSRKLANALAALGVVHGDRVGTIAWNGYRHLELYYAVSGSGAVLHTLNPRLHADQIVWIGDHAEDKVLCFDKTFLPLVEAVASRLATVKHFVLMADRSHMPASTAIPNLLCYEDLVDAQPDDFEWPVFDEETASSLCYTSGTTGNPKGVLYSHRSTVLHTYAVGAARRAEPVARATWCCRSCRCSTSTPGACRIRPAWSARSWCCPARGWTARRCTNCSKASSVTLSAGVPTVWQGLLTPRAGQGPGVLHHAAHHHRRFGLPAGDDAKPSRTRYGVQVIHAWGMTELSPVGTVCVPKAAQAQWPADATARAAGQAGPRRVRHRHEDRRWRRQGAAVGRQGRPAS